MQINFYLDERNSTRKGHPIKITFRHNSEQIIKSIKSYSEKKHWGGENVKRTHPNFYTIKEKIDELSKKMMKA